MNINEANKIIDRYTDSLSKLKQGDIARKRSFLKDSPARIKQAYFVYIEWLVKSQEGFIDKKIGDLLVTTYSAINCFLDDADADRANELFKKFKTTKDMKYWEQFQKEYGGMSSLMSNDKSFDEINEFIGEMQDKYK